MRYTSDQKAFGGTSEALAIVCTSFPLGFPSCPNAPLFKFSTSPAGVGVPVPSQSGGIVPIIPTGALVVRQDTDVRGKLTNNKPTFRGAVEYDVAPRSLLYASVETGYRSGGFSLANGYDTFKPETITAYTLGSKNWFLNGKLELNVELFLWKYKNQQVAHLGLDLAGFQNNFTQNVGKTTNKGLEIETRYALTRSTVLSGNFQYLNAKYRIDGKCRA